LVILEVREIAGDLLDLVEEQVVGAPPDLLEHARDVVVG